MAEEFVAIFSKKSSSRDELFNKYDYETIGDAIIENSKIETGFLIWSAALSEIKDDLLLYEIIKNVLPKLNRDDIKTKQLNDFYSRTCIELSKSLRSPEFVLKVALLCEEFIKIGDPRAPFYKDVLPIALTILNKYNLTIDHKEKSQTGRKYSQEIIDNVLKSNFPVSGITALVSMFKDIDLSQQQHDALITKVSQIFHKVPPNEIATLALATFQTALFNQLLMPILALDKYFHKHRYRKEINESASDIDSIDDAADAGIVEIEEIVIYHFQDTAQYTTIERDLTNAIKSLEFTPRFILTPFISTILLSIAKISSSVEGNFRLNQSTILLLLKQMFKFNEEHKEILRTSGWASSIHQTSEIVNTDTLLRMLKQNTCALKQNTALNGFFGLSFLLLKTKASPELNKFAIEFLNQIIRNRPEFSLDIMKIIFKMLFCEKNKIPIVQCISTILQNRHLDINATKPALNSLIEDLTELDIDTATAIESAIFAAISKSIDLRDHMIEVMKAAMYQKNVQVRQMAIFSFCLMLRKFTKPPARLSAVHHNESRFAHNISFFSLTQSQIPINSINSNVRQVEIMMLEILGMLRKALSDARELRVTLYESLLSSIIANPFIVSNVLEFIEGHFRDYFDCEGDDVINFDRAIRTSNNEVVATDDLGCLLKFIINCVIIASLRNNRENLNCDLDLYQNIINKLIEKISNSTLSSLKLDTLQKKHTIIIPQLLNCIENLMVYCLDESHRDIDKITILFEKHERIKEITKKKSLESGRGKKRSDTRVTIEKLEINYSACIWDLKECASFLELCTIDESLKSNKEFFKFVLQSVSEKIHIVQAAGEHNKMRHSRNVFDSFLTCASILFAQLEVESFSESFRNFSFDCIQFIAEGFRNASEVMQTGFYNKREKLSSFLSALTGKSTDDDSMLREVLARIEKVIEWSFEQEKNKVEFVSTSSGNAMLCSLFTAMQIFSNNFQCASNAQDTFNWILNFAKTSSVKQKNLGSIIIKLLLQSLIQHENSSIIDCIAHKISTSYKYRSEMNEPENASQNNYTIISKYTLDEALVEFIEFIKHQLNIIEVFIKRANSLNAHARLKTDSNNETVSTLQNLEIAIAIKLISLGGSLERIVNCTFPLHTSRHIEKLTKIIRAYYNCLKNLMKHLRKHYDIKNISQECTTSIEKLLKYSRVFAKAVYAFLKYVGSETTNAAKASSSKEKDNRKAKNSGSCLVLSKTIKSISDVILMLETFHKSVAEFDQAAKSNLSRLLHPGEVRDFHIDSNFIANDNQNDDDKSTNESDNESSSEEENINRVAVGAKKRKAPVLSETTSSDEDAELNDNDTPLTRERFEENLKKMQVSKRGGGGGRGRNKKK